jgi:cytochrome c oxidase subunit 4
MSSHAKHPHPKTVSMVTYTLVFISLMVLLVATVWVAMLPWDKWDMVRASVIIALVIAVIKATLVVLFFMHVKMANRLTQVFVVSAFIWLGIMFVFSFADYLTRGWLPNSSGWVAESRLPEPSVLAPGWTPPEHVAQRPAVQPAGGRPVEHVK